MTGSLPDMNLSLDLFDAIGKLRRSANIASRSGQMDELMQIADEIVRWQIRLRRQIVSALGTDNMTDSWAAIVKQIGEMRHERDGAQMLHKLDTERSGDERAE